MHYTMSYKSLHFVQVLATTSTTERLHDDTVLVAIQAPSDFVWIHSLALAVQAHDEHTGVLRIQCRRKLMPKQTGQKVATSYTGKTYFCMSSSMAGLILAWPPAECKPLPEVLVSENYERLFCATYQR